MLVVSFSAALSRAGYCFRRRFPVTLSLKFEHISVMGLPVCCRHRYRLIREDAAPGVERMVTGDDQTAALITMDDQHTCSRRFSGDSSLPVLYTLEPRCRIMINLNVYSGLSFPPLIFMNTIK